MIKSACDAVKMSVMLSAFLFTVGALLEIAAQILTIETSISVYFAFIGIIAMVIAVVLLIATFVAVLIPKVNDHLQSCQH